jgi:hypothetical protein
LTWRRFSPDVLTAASKPPFSATGWIGSVTAAYAQQTGATLSSPPNFSKADLLVAIVANDGPDSNSVETHAVFSGTSGLKWIRHTHISVLVTTAASKRSRPGRGGASVRYSPSTDSTPEPRTSASIHWALRAVFMRPVQQTKHRQLHPGYGFSHCGRDLSTGGRRHWSDDRLEQPQSATGYLQR